MLLQVTRRVTNSAAGKDRTGVLSTLLFDLAGAERETIAFNYALSRIGVESKREILTKNLKAMYPPEITEETPGFKEVASIKEEFILGFLDVLAAEFGGTEGYCKNQLGFTDEEISILKGRLKG